MAKIIKTHLGDGPVNAGEKRLLDFLYVKLPDNYLVIPNGEYSSKTPQGAVKYWEYDAIVIAPHGIYHIENKDWNGSLYGDDFIWSVNGVERKNPHKTATLKTKILAAKLQNHNPSWRFGSIQTVVTLSYPGQSKFGLDPHSDCYEQTFLLNSELIDYLTDNERLRKDPEFMVGIQKEIADYLSGESSHQNYAKKKEILDFAILETLQSNEEYTEYLCQPKIFATKKYKVREYPLSFAGKSQPELERLTLSAQNAKFALQQIETCPNIIKSSFQFNDDHTFFYEYSEYLEGSSLESKLKSKTFTQREKLGIILDIAKALKVAHSHDITHRDVSPENIFILNDGTAALANFGLSYFRGHEDLGFTVMTSVSGDDSPYVAPEMLDGDFCYGSDLFSLGVVFYRLMTGKLPFNSTLLFKLQKGELPEDQLPSKVVSDLPEWMDEVAKHTITANLQKRWAEADEMIEFINMYLTDSEKKGDMPATVEAQLNLKDMKPGMSVSQSLVLYEQLGKGGFGKVFKAKHLIQNKFYAIKIFDRDVSVESTFNEFDALKDVKHDNIVKFVYNDKTSQGLFYTLMELLNGENLGDYTSGDLRLPNSEIYKMATQILSALRYLQDKVPPLFHRDIKPNNIVWDNRQRYVLIDFNISTSVDDKAFAGTLPYMAPDLILSNKTIDWGPSADTFSLGITLYQLVAHAYPWPGSSMHPKLYEAPTDIRKYNDKISDAFADFIMKSIITDKTKRFGTAKEMSDALEAIGPDGIEKKSDTTQTTVLTDDIVAYVNSLYSQSVHGNGGTRAGAHQSILDQKTYTKTKLDYKLLKDIADLKYKLVIITGNAGDGKTAFLKQVEALGTNRVGFQTKNGSEFTLNGVKFQSNYDGSQDESDKANDAVLRDFFAPFIGSSDYTHSSEGRIIAINEGRLVDFLETEPGLKPLQKSIEDYFYNEGHSNLLPGLMIINLNLRSVTAREGNAPSLLSQQIKAITNPELWGKCQGCPLADKCFIKYNVDTFNDSSAGDEVINRLEWLLRAVVYKRELHITMRDLRSFISFMLTRDYSCEEVKQLVEFVKAENKPELYWNYYYFNITAPALHYNGNFPLRSTESNDRLVKILRDTDIAKVALPANDRDLYFKEKRANGYLIFNDRKQSLLNDFNAVNEVLPIWKVTGENVRFLISLRHQTFIRHQYFEGKIDYMKRLPYRYIEDFAKKLKSFGEESLKETMSGLSRAISISEGCDAPALTEGYLLLSNSQVGDPLSKSYRRFSIDEFELFVNKTDHLTEYIEYESDSFTFRHKTDKFIQLTVSLDLYEMLQYISSGFNPSVNDLQGKFIELQIFKNLLQSKTYKEILVTKNNRKFTVVRLEGNKHITVEPLK